MTILQEWSTVTVEKLQDLWGGFLNFIPKLVGALIVFVVGWLIAVWVGKIISELLRRAKFDKIFEKTKWDEALDKADVKMDMSGFIGALVKWILAIVFLSAAVEILGLAQFAIFLGAIVSWLPNVVVAAAIFVVAVIVADFAEKVIKAIVGKMNVKYVNLVGAVVRWAIWVFAGLIILSQLGVGAEIMQILISGFVGLIVVSAALAFGLGGKDLAREILEDMRMKMKE